MNTSKFQKILKKIDCTKNTFSGVYPSGYAILESETISTIFVATVDTGEKTGNIGWHFILLISVECSLTYTLMDYFLTDTQNVLKIS